MTPEVGQPNESWTFQDAGVDDDPWNVPHEVT